MSDGPVFTYAATLSRERRCPERELAVRLGGA